MEAGLLEGKGSGVPGTTPGDAAMVGGFCRHPDRGHAMNTIPERGTPITLSQAASLLAERDVREGDKECSAGNPGYQRAIKRIKDAAKREELEFMEDGTVMIEKFVGWARSLTLDGVLMDDKFRDFPVDVLLSFEAEPVLIGIESEVIRQADSTNLANQKWAEDQRELERLKEEVERLRPLAERKIRNDEVNRANARKKEDFST